MKTMDRFVNIDTPQRYKELIEEVLQELKFVIPYHADTFKMCKATGYYGRCKQRGSRFYIYLSQYLDNCTDHQIKEVIAHELIHTCKFCMNHGDDFQIYANKLFNYGYCVLGNNYKQFGDAIKECFKYVYTCPKCGKEFPRQRRLNLDKWKCKCGSKLELKEEKC